MEFALHGFAEFSKIGRRILDDGSDFRDLLDTMLPNADDFDEDDEDYFENDRDKF